MNFKELKNQIKYCLENKTQFSPTIFLGGDLVKNNLEVTNFILELFSEHKVDKNNLYQILDNGENIKIEEARQFIEKASQIPNDKFQIFFIENISRLTISSGNSLLKFLEEPPVGNLIFMTNKSENQVLETILSRCKKIKVSENIELAESSFYHNLIDEYIKLKSTSIFSYFYKNKLEKDEYIDFLVSIINYSKQNLVFEDFLDKIEDDITLIKNNNLNPKNIVFKYLIKIKNHESY